MNKKLNLIFSSIPFYSGNPKAMYEYFLNNHPNKYNLIWHTDSEKDYQLYKNNKFNCIYRENSNFYEIINTADVFFTSHSQLISEKKEYQIYVNLWHGVGIKKVGFMLNTSDFSKEDYDYYNMLRKKTNYIIVPSEFWKSIYCSTFNISTTNILTTGLPRTCFIDNSKHNLQKLLLPNYKSYNKIILYLPTFRNMNNKIEGSMNLNNIINLITYDENLLFEFLENNNYLLIIKMHPLEKLQNKITTHKNIIYLSQEILNEHKLDINEIIAETDLLISDYSSIYIEYLLTNKPILFLNTDIDKYMQTRGLLFNNSHFWFPGPQVNNLVDFMSETQKLLTDNSYFKYERNKFTDLMYNESTSIDCCSSLYQSIFTENYTINPACFSSRNKEDLFEDTILSNNITIENLKNQNNLLEDTILTSNITLENSINSNNIVIEQLKNIIKLKVEELNSLNKDLTDLTLSLKNKNDEITTIQNSRFWKISKFYNNLKYKFKKLKK